MFRHDFPNWEFLQSLVKISNHRSWPLAGGWQPSSVNQRLWVLCAFIQLIHDGKRLGIHRWKHTGFPEIGVLTVDMVTRDCLRHHGRDFAWAMRFVLGEYALFLPFWPSLWAMEASPLYLGDGMWPLVAMGMTYLLGSTCSWKMFSEMDEPFLQNFLYSQSRNHFLHEMAQSGHVFFVEKLSELVLFWEVLALQRFFRKETTMAIRRA